MRCSIRLSDAFKADIAQTAEYIGSTLCNKSAAAKLIAETKAEIDLLADFPKSCPICSEPRLQAKGIRKLIVKNFIVLYSLEESDSVITAVNVLRFVYGRRNYAELL